MIFTSSSISFSPEKDIPSLNGKVILITGGNTGLGKQAVVEFARHKPLQIWLAARNLQKAEAAVAEIKQQVPDAPIKLLELDLASFDSIRQAARSFLEESERLDILMLNAGIMAVPPALTKDGYEIQFGTNHMGHAYLTKLLLPVLEKTSQAETEAKPRVVCLASHGHVYLCKGGFDFSTLRTTGESTGPLQCYYQSKLANMLWVRQLAKRYPQLTVSAIDPGLVQTELAVKATGINWVLRTIIKTMLLTPVEKGVKNQLWASVSKGVKSGEYYEPIGREGLATDDGKDDELAAKLWAWTENELDNLGI
ncbi:uncharacterized protein NECHADRAFT_84229 [Fusarium vanettenii 77-13-4]|uniref:Short-chain dehydrogenase/reductase n=1 Tax=Fusarium vanettenii (strain ATCC MYA-4622 / CBS 123669 / FGSC 9596 / NRRL 45880 / 77-13-4) TaxID=660122 RepID=C7Z028_FUSV7|nr:uncharacterized protein NECHADRAFT_84229 [Fusarium vanettenii 77-13-4]EEU42898.1 hypothetical protein NECHADRAFT_84229 [Fusarium vanettenii 77-13-4]